MKVARNQYESALRDMQTNRRSMLQAIGHAGLAALLTPGISLVRSNGAKAAQVPLIQPSEIRSQNGVLDATLTAAPGRLQLGETELPGFFYNGSYLPPLLRLRLGDVIRIRFKNNLIDGLSNLHYHGMNVSPRGRSDNVFIHVPPGHEFNYEVPVPSAGRQGPGMFWYHPHGHGFVTKQMLGGMSGGLVLDGSEMLFPILQGLPERFFLIKHAEPGNNREIISINGQLNPVVDIRPGEMQFWRIANIGATLFFPLQIQGMPLYVMATDGHPLSQPRKINEVLLGPGQRIDAIAVGPPAGEYTMRTLTWPGGSRFYPSKSRPSCRLDLRLPRISKRKFCANVSIARGGSTRCDRLRSLENDDWCIRERMTETSS
jgi:suppressor of ftsI